MSPERAPALLALLARFVLALLVVATMLLTAAGCAFPLFNMEEPATPRRFRYTSRNEVAPAREQSARSEPTPRAAPRNSVLAPIVPEPEAESGSAPRSRPAPRVEALPQGSGSCYQQLRAAGVRFESVASSEAPGVRWPVRLLGPVGGVSFEPSDTDPTHAILDCRLGLSLLAWAQDLRRVGVRRVEHYSMYRPGAHVAGTDTVSGHAHGLAIDAARFTLDNGAVLDVMEDWEGRKRGQSPCPVRRDEALGSRLLRRVTCDPVDEKLFQVVLTPHYNKAHENHVHLERKPDVDWTFVR